MSAVCAVYGGTFDPPHVGHVLSIAWALSAGGVDRVLVVPTFEHPFGKAPSASFEDRRAMCELSLAKLRSTSVDSIEAELGGESRTLRTLEALTQRMPGISLRLLLGADAFAERDRWHRWDRIAGLAPPLVVGREGYPPPPSGSPAIPNVSSTELRHRLARGEPVDGLVPTEVVHFIRERGLYRGEAP